MKNNKNILIILCALVSVLIITIWFTKANKPSIQEQVSSIDLQAKCDTQAKKDFNQNWSSPSGGISDYNYKNHYNTQTGKCYILTSGVGAGGENYQLSDAFENGSYIALCSSYTVAPEMNSCDYPNSKKEKFDKVKFDNFVKPYMEN
ncbi:MAG: hypothetical protein KGI58_03105 [Patescibacteria group bacterium]|nr:hypothetical protein [Patescibacteria group bacterium]